jgi:spermidine synthase
MTDIEIALPVASPRRGEGSSAEGPTSSSPSIRGILFILFFVSGFCGLVYQVIWMRLAFASFGIITPVMSVVLSVFMLGLSIGAWLAGRSIAFWVRKTGLSALLLYGAAELLIGVGAFAVPALFTLGERYLLGSGQTDSIGYLFSSAVVLAVSILPWCVCMGATFPFMMAFVREWDRQFTGSFSYLYLANVLGAMSGTFMTAAVLVEAYGFQHTLWIAASGNFAIAAASVGVAWSRRKTGVIPLEVDQSGPEAVRPELGGMPGRQVNRLLLDGDGGGLVPVVHSRAEDPGVFVRGSCIRLSRRHISWIAALSLGAAQKPGANPGSLDFAFADRRAASGHRQ